MFDIDILKEHLERFEALRDTDAIQTDSVDNIEPQYVEKWLLELCPPVRVALHKAGIDKLYKHQVEAISKALSGVDVVLSSPTASGKTLAFTVPMLDALVRNRDSHALMIYPMKALAFDQRTQIEALGNFLSIEVATCDGDTSPIRKKELKQKPPQILLTNPEGLNINFLGWRNQWETVLKNLKYLIIDEMHDYRGYFGSNVSLLLRRFFLYLDSIGVNPRVFLSTATCANPSEHAKNLTGRDTEIVSAPDALRPRRHFMFVNPEVPDYRHREIVRLRVEQAALAILAAGLQALVFCPTKRFLEDAFSNCRKKAENNDLDAIRIDAFHADRKAVDKQRIQQGVKNGDINIVFTTNALELGVDIGGLDGVILAGFPPNVMSAWQQIGRAGRGWDKEAFVLFYAMNDPIDQFFVCNLDAFLKKKFDALIADPSNKELIDRHIPSLNEETAGVLSASAKRILGNCFYDVAKKDIKLKSKRVRYTPQWDLNKTFRGSFGKSYLLKCDDSEIGSISEMRLFREAYLGAIFAFGGHKYIVHSHEKDAVVLMETEQQEQYRKTEPHFFTRLVSLKPSKSVTYGTFEANYGVLSLSLNFTGYTVVDERTGENIETISETGAKYMDDLHAFWVEVSPSELANEAIGALEHIIRVGAMFVIPADRFDTSTYSRVGEEPFASYYENYSGGIGVAKKLFDVLPDVLEKGIEIAQECECSNGCPNCIQPAKSYHISNEEINKISGIKLAEDLLNSIN